MTSDELYEKGLSLLRENNTLSALASFEKAYALKKTPVIMSFLGVCISQERGQITEAISLCENAISQEPDNNLLYLNLGRVFLKAGRRSEALAILRKGLSYGDSLEIRELLEKLGRRRNPLFPFLDRKNILNKLIGQLLERIGIK